MKTAILMMSILIPTFATTSALAQNSRPARSCDAYIAQYCANSQDRGPACLKGHESDVSAACLEDMQKSPPEGARPSGPPPANGGTAQ